MPDKEIMLQIRAREESRAWDMLWSLADEVPERDRATSPRDPHYLDELTTALITTLTALVESWRTSAELYEKAKLKGAQTAHVIPLRHAAQQLDKVIEALNQPRRAALGELQPPNTVQDPCDMVMKPHAPHAWTHPDGNIGVLHCPGVGTAPHGSTVNAGLDEPVHRFQVGLSGTTCTAMVERGGAGEDCGRYASHPAHRLQSGPAPEETIASLDALIAESAAAAHPLMASVGAVAMVINSPTATLAAEMAEAQRAQDCCGHMLDVDEDPAPWCDCRADDRGKHSGPCKYKAHRREDHPVTDFPGQASAEEVTAYLRGDVDDIPGPPLAPNGITDMTTPGPWDPDGLVDSVAGVAFTAVDTTDAETLARLGQALGDTPPPAVHRTAREILESNPVTMPSTPSIPPVPLLGQPGNGGPAYGHSYIPPGGVPATYTELLTPVPRAALPAHISHSQISTAGECGVKYRLQRLPRDERVDQRLAPVEQIPQWANIGGNAFHAVVESLERLWTANPSDPFDVVTADEESERLWGEAFGAEIARIEGTSPVPRSRWRAARKGAESEAWWWTNGPLMIERYLKARPSEPTAMLDAPAIELERTVPVDTPYGPIDYRAIIDRVTVRTDPAGATTLVIRDYKTGYQMPDSTQQLGEYAQVLRLLGVPVQIKITGTYFNARKGEWTPEADLEADGWSVEWFRYHVATGHAERLKLTSGPTPARPSQFCGGCPVRWACPLKNGAKS